ncbi:SusC/RagA family TonB-linked outer membrane protein [Aestuariivivens sediminicola]|uniref:SusC/RagA family TonB-linked outer membrane protein n=1 Tax=Aestuariivivens sediminicola TaxID=2913560 RepID=UPI001F586D98|nr:TonB-dependent receptor [Aestuariivivens sediminicola]
MKIKQTRIHLFLTVITLLGINGLLYAQTIQVSGLVIDDKGLPLPGVTILEKGTTNGAITDFDGLYQIDVSSESTLIFSYIGFQTQEISVSGQNSINVTLNVSTTDLDEITIVAYGQQKKIAVTGAISTVESEELVKSPAPNIANSLAGKVTGFATVQFSGQPGADEPNIYLRGIASLSEGRSVPLFIVDGVERPFTSLDPNEIESISILKDASATAVYGVRGANGVVLVTTKRGKFGKPKISASFSTGLQEPTRLLDFADSYTYALRYNEAELNDNPNLSPEELRFTPQVVEAFRTGSDPIMFPNLDWLDYILKPTASQSQGNVNLTGGTEKVKYFVSLGILNQDGLFKTFETGYDYNFSFKRYNYRTNLDIDITGTTKLAITIGGRVGVTNRPNTNGNFNELFRNTYWSVPFASPGIIDGKLILIGNDYIPDNKRDGLSYYYGQGYTNITSNRLNFDIGLNQNLNFLKGLKFRTKFAYNTDYVHRKIRNSSLPNYTPVYLRDIDPNADQSSDEIVFQRNGSAGNLGYSESYGTDRNWYLEGGLSYKNSFGDHDVGALALYNQQKVYYPEQFPDIPRGLVGFVGRVNYEFKNKYFLDLSIGYNGSENFARNRRFGTFPAASVGWVLTNESFMKNQSFLDFFKLRVSYGLVGNDRIGDPGTNRFLYLPNSYDPSDGSYSFGTDNPQNQQAASEGQIGNPNVSWETSEKQNYGINLKFLKNKLGINVDYFIENRSDILTFRGTVPGFVAYDLPAVNIGKVRNEGFEIELEWNHTVNDDFKYWINANMSHAKNEIVFQDEVPQTEDYLYRTGLPVGQPFGYIFDKFYNDTDTGNDQLPDHQYDLQGGDMVYKDLNDDGVIDQNDQRAIGYPVYPFNVFGLNMGFRFKNLDFSMSWVGATNTSRYLGETYRVAFGATLNRSLLQYMADGRWTPETADSATYPRMTLVGTQNNTKDSNFWLRDASYARLRNVELGYNFKSAFLKSIGISNLRTYMNGLNLITISKLDLTDPESRTANDSQYPLTKVYNLGVKVNFL